MRSLIKGQEKGFFELTNHQVEQLKMTEGFNQNHIGKIMLGHIEVYKNIIEHLLEERAHLKSMLDEEVEDRR